MFISSDVQVLQPSEMDNDLHFNYHEFELGKRTLREYSNYEGRFNQFNLRGRYWRIDMWDKVVERYNILRMQVPQARVLQVNDFVSLCKQIQSQYYQHRASKEGYGHTDMETVFSPCTSCQLRIPVFPNKFAYRSTSHQTPSASISNSNSGQRRSHADAFGNNNILTNHSSSVSQLGLDLRKMVYKMLHEMKEKGHLTGTQYRRLIGRTTMLDALWPLHILDDSIPLSERARDVIDEFYDGASTSRQH